MSGAGGKTKGDPRRIARRLARQTPSIGSTIASPREVRLLSNIQNSALAGFHLDRCAIYSTQAPENVDLRMVPSLTHQWRGSPEGGGRRAAARFLARDEARRIAANIAKPPAAANGW